MNTMPINLLRRTCLKTHYSLRYQLWFSFGSISIVAILVIISTSIAVAMRAGGLVQSYAKTTLTEQVIRTASVSSKAVADIISRRSDGVAGAVAILAEITSDRIVGRNWESDDQVPFYDMLTNMSKYPLAPVYLPPDWNISINVNEDNYVEHIQEARKNWYPMGQISTEHAAFRFQGQCDPMAKVNDMAYYPNCTDANNDVTTCGVVQSVESLLYEKVGFLQYILKPLYEAHISVKMFGVYFVNDGAGASVVFPAQKLNYNTTHISAGCQWMLDNLNPNTGRPFATPEQVKRCHEEEEHVNAREYNALERGWCQYQALAGGRSIIFGPYLDAFQKDLWLISFGQAVFDKVTGEFIACTLADVSINHLSEVLNKSAGEYMRSILVRWQDGEVIAGGAVHRTKETSIMVEDVGFTRKEFEFAKSAVGANQRQSYSFYTESGDLAVALAIPTTDGDDTDFTPTALLITVMSDDVFSVIDNVEEAVSGDVREVLVITAILGAFGLIVALSLTWLVSRCLTQPLEWMENISRRIVYSEVGIDVGNRPLMRLTPKTEITTLVDGFRKMIQGFSGDGPADIAQSGCVEILNTLECTGEFNQLRWRNSDGFEGDVMKSETLPLREASSHGTKEIERLPPGRIGEGRSLRASHKFGAEELTDAESVSSNSNEQEQKLCSNEESFLLNQQQSMRRIHRGRNITPNHEIEEASSGLQKRVGGHATILRSPLFWWILILLEIPVLVTFFFISDSVSRKIMRTLPSLLEETSRQSFTLEEEHISVVTLSRASFAGEVLAETVRDLHLISRVSEWLLLGVVERTDAFTLVDESTEECKYAPPDQSCHFFDDNSRTPCDCAWEDIRGFPCEHYEGSSMMRRRQFFLSQRNDADLLTGERNSTSFPLVDSNPNATRWWHDLNELPGATNESEVGGYGTTYNRVRVLSAISVVEFPIFNYALHADRITHLGIYVGLEADGMLFGTAGCDYSHAEYSHFRASNENGAAVFRPDLCPLGKYGFDPRCRGWYAKGKDMKETYMTAPYEFAGGNYIATSITSPIYDPVRELYLGQVLLDFIPDGLLEGLSKTRIGPSGKGFVIVIAPTEDVNGGDTVVGPNYSFGNSSPPIGDLLLPYDNASSDLRKQFDLIVNDMKTGTAGTGTFSRSSDDGTHESLFLVFAPVNVRTVQSINGSNFARGISENTTTVYLLGIVMPEEELGSTFSDSFADSLWSLVIVYAAISIVNSIVVTILTSMVAISVTKPVILLCGIIEKINDGCTQDTIPPLNGGSREVNQVYNSFSKLCKIVHFSNIAFFSGNMDSALKFLTDALKLYRNIDDKKAIGLCNNNLGNTYLSLFLSKRGGTSCYCVSDTCVAVRALECYTEAINVATGEYEFAVSDERVNDETRSEYARQLANRLFNRGVFLFLIADDACAPKGWTETAIQDLESASMLDVDVRDFWIRTRSVKANSEKYFERLLRRGSGLVSCLEFGSAETDNLLLEADSLLCSIGKDDQAPVIQGMKLRARLQQLEEVAIRNELRQGNVEDAARFAARMLMEDEFLIESAFCAAAEAILKSMKVCDNLKWDPKTICTAKKRIRDMLKSCKSPETLPSLEKGIVICMDCNVRDEGNCLQAMQQGAVKLYEKVCNEDDDIGLVLFTDTVDDNSSFGLTKKTKLTTEKITGLSINSSHGFRRTQLGHGIHRALGMVQSCESENWIVIATDCESWGNLSDWQSVYAQVLDICREKSAHVIVIGIDLNENMKSNFRSMCRHRGSALIETKADEVSILEGFAEAATLIEGGVVLRGFTTEKF